MSREARAGMQTRLGVMQAEKRAPSLARPSKWGRLHPPVLEAEAVTAVLVGGDE